MEQNIPSVKVCLLGNSGVGKTCIIHRFIKNEFKENSISTRGADYAQKKVETKNQAINLDIWDTAGQEQYRSLGIHFYKEAYIVILVYDITNEESFEDLKNVWYNDLKRNGEKYTVLAIVGNKSDMFEEEEKISEEEGRKFAEEVKAVFMLVSAKNGNNIENLFKIVASKYLDPLFQDKFEGSTKKNDGNSIKIKKHTKEEEQKIVKSRKKGCC